MTPGSAPGWTKGLWSASWPTSNGTRPVSGTSLSRRDQLNKIARRQIEDIGRASGDRYVADRQDILRGAQALIKELEAGDAEDIYDVLAVAVFLAGDNGE